MQGTTIIQNKEIFYKFINTKYLSTDKPIIIFLHEGLGCSEQWRKFPNNISDTLKIPALLYDRYGYGKSQIIHEARKTNYMEIEAEIFLPKLINNLKLSNNPIILMGHSDGGTISMLFTSNKPNNVIGLIMEAPHFFIEDISFEGIKNAKSAYENSNFKEKLQKYHGKNTERMVLSWTEVLLTEEMKSWNVESKLENIDCPVLAIQGSDDNFGTLKQIESIKNSVKGYYDDLIIQECGHIPHHQDSDVVSERIISFLKNVVLKI